MFGCRVGAGRGLVGGRVSRVFAGFEGFWARRDRVAPLIFWIVAAPAGSGSLEAVGVGVEVVGKD